MRYLSLVVFLLLVLVSCSERGEAHPVILKADLFGSVEEVKTDVTTSSIVFKREGGRQLPPGALVVSVGLWSGKDYISAKFLKEMDNYSNQRSFTFSKEDVSLIYIESSEHTQNIEGDDLKEIDSLWEQILQFSEVEVKYFSKNLKSTSRLPSTTVAPRGGAGLYSTIFVKGVRYYESISLYHWLLNVKDYDQFVKRKLVKKGDLIIYSNVNIPQTHVVEDFDEAREYFWE
ncbi:MAG: hypothetical protein ACFHU9_06630 [Fluviicola sp.]